jgi:hypothetical protein
MTRLTKDQRRAQKKQKERKVSVQREQSQNREQKTFAKAIAQIIEAAHGMGDADQLSSAILKLFRGQSDKELPAPFDSQIWGILKENMQSLAYHSAVHSYETESPDEAIITGRIFLVDEVSHKYVTEHFPFAAVMASQLPFDKVVPVLSREIMDKLTPGAYVFGVTMGELAVNLALVTSTANPEETSYYLIEEDDWYKLDALQCERLLGRLIHDFSMNNDDEGAQHYGDAALIQAITGVEHDDNDAEFSALSSEHRSIIMAGGSGLIRQVDMLIDTIRGMEIEADLEGSEQSIEFNVGWSEGHAAGLSERADLMAKLQRAQEEEPVRNFVCEA